MRQEDGMEPRQGPAVGEQVPQEVEGGRRGRGFAGVPADGGVGWAHLSDFTSIEGLQPPAFRIEHIVL